MNLSTYVQKLDMTKIGRAAIAITLRYRMGVPTSITMIYHGPPMHSRIIKVTKDGHCVVTIQNTQCNAGSQVLHLNAA